MFDSILSLVAVIFSVAIGFSQYKQNERMEKLQKEIYERDKQSKRNSIEQSVYRLKRELLKENELKYWTESIVASFYNSDIIYKRKIYNEFILLDYNSKEIFLGNYMKIYDSHTNKNKSFYKEIYDIYEKLTNKFFQENGKDMLYDNLKYFENSIKDYSYYKAPHFLKIEPSSIEREYYDNVIFKTFCKEEMVYTYISNHVLLFSSKITLQELIDLDRILCDKNKQTHRNLITSYLYCCVGYYLALKEIFDYKEDKKIEEIIDIKKISEYETMEDLFLGTCLILYLSEHKNLLTIQKGKNNK